MIAVIAPECAHEVVREFFELFKTPWEFHKEGRTYDIALLADGERGFECDAKLVIVYGSQRLTFDDQNDTDVLYYLLYGLIDPDKRRKEIIDEHYSDSCIHS